MTSRACSARARAVAMFVGLVTRATFGRPCGCSPPYAITIAGPGSVSTSPGSLSPVAFSTWSAMEDVDGGETGGQPTEFGRHFGARAPNIPDSALHAVLTILPGEAIAAAPIVPSGRPVSMSLESP